MVFADHTRRTSIDSILSLPAGFFDGRARSEAFEKVSALTLCGLRQPFIPFGQKPSQIIAQCQQFLDALIQPIEPLADERTNALARCTASIPHA